MTMTSISGTVAAPLPATFSLSVYGGAARQLDKELAPKPNDELARQRAAKRKAQHEVEMLALEWSKVMLEKTIQAALDPKTDPALAHKMRMDLLNRGIGKVRETEGDEDAKKQKGVGVQEFLEALASVSTIQGAIERTPPSTHRIERDVGGSRTDLEAERFLSDLKGDGEIDDEHE
jgi:hypothetical protein